MQDTSQPAVPAAKDVRLQLNDGNSIPCIGYGTWDLKQTPEDVKVITEAVNTGYRLFDTAAFYKCESTVGAGLKASGIPRNELFITSKVWHTELAPNKIRQSLNCSLKELETSYLDLLLIHWPRNPHDQNWKATLKEAWATFEQLKKEGLVKSIGVSNFLPHHLTVLEGMTVPAVDQLEFHPGYIQRPAVEYCQRNHIMVQAWSPLGQRRLRDNEFLKDLGKRYHRTPEQVCLRFAVQMGIIPIPKSADPWRMRQNIEVFDFDLDPSDIAAICDMPVTAWSGEHPDSSAPDCGCTGVKN